MEIKITHLIERHSDMHYYSRSQAEGGPTAGQDSWHDALDNYDADNPDGEPLLVTTSDDVQEVKDYFGEFGAWDDEERESWTDQEVNALLLQFIAGDIREALPELIDDYAEYQRQAERGSISGRIYRGDDGEWYYYVGM